MFILRPPQAFSKILPRLAPLALLPFFPPSPAAELLPPGHRPPPPGVHAIRAARIFPNPSQTLTNASILIRDGRIEAIGPDIAIPPDARVWNLTNSTVYPGFIDLHAPLSGKPVDSGAAFVIAQSEEDLTAGALDFIGLPTADRDPGTTGPGSDLSVIQPEYRAADSLSLPEKTLESFRSAGFTAANIVPPEGILRGSSAFTLLSSASPNRAILRADVFQHAALDPNATANRPNHYPRSLMGVIAALRQTFADAQHLHRLSQLQPPQRDPLLGFNASLAALEPVISRRRPIVFEPGSALMVDRTARIAAEFGLDFLILASGQEWRRPDLAAATRARFIVPLAFPELPDLPQESDWEKVTLDQLRTWDWAIENPALLRSHQLQIALTAYGLSDRGAFRKNLRQAIDRGLSETDALAALTLHPAEWAGAADLLGTLTPGKLANLTVVDGSYFDPKAKMHSVWIEGRSYPLADPPDLSDPPAKPAAKPKSEPQDPAPPRLAKSPLENRGPITAQTAILFRNATLWTCGPEGILPSQDLLIAGGKIAGVGISGSLKVNQPEDFLEIDATGWHITPGLIDCHSHSFILGAVNEMSLPSTAMVRVGDVINSETQQIYRELAGGLTAANLLHGSANPIGGQNAVVKLRWGASPEGMKFADAPPGIKFALGENVKQSSRTPPTPRFPASRMGVPVFIANRFTAAQAYREALRNPQNANSTQSPPRRDLELEALAEILEGKRLIHCHSYRQDEIIAFLRLMERFGVQVATLQHILEGYKVADEIAAHGAGASAFSDWWGFKHEVYDAIPFAGALMHDRGVVVSFNSDSADLARRLNREAAKAVKYGGLPETEALKFVTLNPAKQLRVDHRVGSLEIGKDGDLAIWSAHPFAPNAICLQTWIDGKKYFDRSLEPARVQAAQTERNALLERARKKSRPKDPPSDKDARSITPGQALFFRQALEHARRFGYSCCENHQTLSLQP